MPKPRIQFALAVVIAIVAFAFNVGLQSYMRPHARDGIYFQEWTSDTMMQTVAIEDLRKHPFETLWNIHIQPPAFDTLRAVLAYWWSPLESHQLLHKVDHSIYTVWAVVGALLSFTIFIWLSQTTRTSYAFFATLIFIPHPGVIFYSTLLETSFLSGFLILLTYYLLWRLSKNPSESILPVALAVLSLFFTRSMFQGPWIILFTASLVLLRVPFKSIATFMLVCGVVMGCYLTKHYYKFGTLSTHGWRGLNFCRGINSFDRFSLPPYLNRVKELPPGGDEERSLPTTLIRREKLTGAPNLNHISYVEHNAEIWSYCNEHFRKMSWAHLMNSYRENMEIYFRPSSRYVTAHVIVDTIPWRDAYEKIFSHPVLPIAIITSLAFALLTSQLRDIPSLMALLLPGLFIFAICITAEKGENMRMKFFLEPVFYVLIVTQGYRLVSKVWRMVRSGGPVS
jgi:hypothetical protein